MSRKDYIETAYIINEFARESGIPVTLHHQEHFDNMVQHFANMFTRDNPNFDRRKFLAAIDRFGE
jgi:hypothetical protein